MKVLIGSGRITILSLMLEKSNEYFNMVIQWMVLNIFMLLSSSEKTIIDKELVEYVKCYHIGSISM